MLVYHSKLNRNLHLNRYLRIVYHKCGIELASVEFASKLKPSFVYLLCFLGKLPYHTGQRLIDQSESMCVLYEPILIDQSE